MTSDLCSCKYDFRLLQSHIDIAGCKHNKAACECLVKFFTRFKLFVYFFLYSFFTISRLFQQ